MDVTFREYELFYGSSRDTGITLLPPEGQQEGEDGSNSVIPILVPPLGGSLIHDNVSSSDNNLSSCNGNNLSSSNDLSQGEEMHHDGPDSGSCPGDTMDATNSSLSSQGEESTMPKDPGTYPNSIAPICTAW